MSKSRCVNITKQLLAAQFLAALILSAQQPSPTKRSGEIPASSPDASEKTASVPPEKVVLTVGDNKMTAADVDYAISILSSEPQVQSASAKRDRVSLGSQIATMLVLAQQAVRDHLDTSPAVLRQIAFHRNEQLARAEYLSLVNNLKVDSQELDQYYSVHHDEFRKIRLRRVLVRKKPEGTKEDAVGLNPEEARVRAEAIRNDLRAGKDVKEVAEQFKSRKEGFIDLDPRDVRITELQPEWRKAVLTTKDGNFSELIESPQSTGFVHVVAHSFAEFKDVFAEIEGKLRQEKVQAAMQDLVSKTSVWLDDDFFNTGAVPTNPAAAASVQPASPHVSLPQAVESHLNAKP